MAFAPYPGSIKEHTDILGAVWHRLPFPAGWREVVQEHFVVGGRGELPAWVYFCAHVFTEDSYPISLGGHQELTVQSNP